MRSIEEIKNEWTAALTEFSAAVQEYEKFVVSVPMGNAEKPEQIKFDELKIAYDRLNKAQNWLGRIRDEHYKAVEGQNKSRAKSEAKGKPHE